VNNPTPEPRLRVALLFDWFFYYTSAIANGLAQHADILMIMRDHGYELGVVEHAAIPTKRGMLEPEVRVAWIRGRRRSVTGIVTAAQAATALRAFKPDVLHIQQHDDWRLWLIQKSAMGTPSVLTLHAVDYHVELGRSPALTPFDRIVRRSADAYIVLGANLVPVVERQTCCKTGKPIHVVPHGPLSYPSASCPLPDSFTALFFGHIEYYKGLDIFIRAVELAACDVPDIRAIIAGRGPDVSRCMGLPRLPQLFEWREGRIPDADLPQLLAESSVVVLPYREAGQSGVIPVAFANARTVIVTPVGALVDAVSHNINGVVTEDATAEAVAEALVLLARSPRLLGNLSRGAHETMLTGSLSQTQVVRRHLEIYHSLARVSAVAHPVA